MVLGEHPVSIVRTPDGVRIDGELDVATAPALADTLLPLPDWCTDIDVDLGGVEFMDSSALSVLVRVHQAADAERRRVRIVHPTPSVRRLLEITSLAEMFGVLDDA